MMFSRTLRVLGRRWRLSVTVFSVVLALVAAYLVGVKGTPGFHAPATSPGTAVPVHAVPGHRVRVPVMRQARRQAPSWPSARTATVALTEPGSARAAGRPAAGPSAGSAQAGTLPVWVGQPDATGAAGKGQGKQQGNQRRKAKAKSQAPVARAQVTLAPRPTARTLGVPGVVLAVQRADGITASGRVHVSLSYKKFAQAYGAGFGSRLRLVELRACALTTPAARACRQQTTLGSLNDARRDWVGADVTLPSARSGAVVLAAVATPSGSAGNFAAEPLSEANTGWVTGPSSGAYTYSYPVAVPPVPGGLAPTVALSYDSQATSGLTSSTNNQASWAGDGWSYSPGFIETDYTTCSQDAGEPSTGDLCPNGATISMSLNGVTTTLVNGSGKWVAQADGGESIKQSGNSWEVIAPNGTQYYFGLNQLPGYASGDQTTNSLWTVPVWEGCGQASLCSLPWRYNLDYVVDTHGNAIAYFYNTQTNYYSEQNGGTANGAYTQGGVLTSIEYGLRAGQVYTSTPAGQVNFTSVAGRQDAPTDLSCASGAACAITSPTFWNNDALTTITTKALEGSTLTNADSYALATTYPATGDPTTSPSLWLSSITRTGDDGGTPITLPPTSFAGTPLPNRVQTSADATAGYSQLTRFYLNSVTSDTGAVTSVAYTSPDPAPCAAGTFPAPSANTAACYPDQWTPPGGSPVQDWFNQYAVASVTQHDTTGGDPDQVTSYTYTGPAWHYDLGTVSRSAPVTYDQWRGFGQVTAETGTAPDSVTETATLFLQGMSQNGPPTSTGPTVSVTTSRGQQITDLNQLAGLAAEQIIYNGAGTGQEVTDTVSLPWTSTAVVTNSSLNQAAYLTGTSSTLTYTPLAAGGTRQSTINYIHNGNGLVTSESDIPDTGNTAESTCTDTTYDANAGTGLIDLPATVITDAGACNASGNGTGALVSETESFYDGQGLGIAPTAGNLTKSEQATATGTFDITTSTYDQYGRVLTSTNPDGNATVTAYTPATGAEPTSVSVTDPMGLITTTSYDPAREAPLTVTKPDGEVTTTAYDALGRQTSIWSPGNPATGPATTTYSYAVSTSAPPVTTENVLEPNGSYRTTDTIYDSFGNVREAQAQTAGGGTDVTDTSYNSNGWQSQVSGPYYVAQAPSGTLVEAASGTVPDEVEYAYDGDGRVVRQISAKDGTQTWETDTSYGGNETTLTPPAGGTPQTTWTDGRGLTTAIWQYHAGVPVSISDPAADYDATSYTYNSGKKLATITDAAGNSWSYTYDLLGNQLTSTTPDAGKTTNTYDAAEQLMTVTDARGKTVSYTYDADGRKTAKYDTTGGAAENSGDELASWTYDTVAKGQLTSSTAFQNGSAYTKQVTGYAANGQPSGTQTIIPASQGALAGTYTQTFTYAPSGQETSYTDSAAGGLPAETVTTGYNSAGYEDSLTGASPYVDSLSYTNLNQPLLYTMGTSSEPVYITDSYDPETGNVTEQNTQISAAQTSVDDLNYAYNNAGNITSEADTPSGASAATDVQCFQYDYLGRLTQSWAQGTASCAATPSASAEGGAAPYWDSYAYNAIGNVTGITSTNLAGQVTTTADTYPATGAAHPHAITGESVTAPSGSTSTSYGYDASGNLTTVTGGGQSQALSWNDAGQLSQDAVTPAGGGTAQNTTYTYDADGNQLITADPGTTTLYLPDEQLSLNTATGTVTGTRFYALGGTPVATLTSGSTGVSYLAGDQQQTDALAISAANLALTRRYYDPYGNPRGAAPSSFPAGEKGFVGGVADSATGLTDLGVREYQPQSGSFISTDPLLDAYNPGDLNSYTYATDNPTTLSDPTGASATPTENTYYIPGCFGPNGEVSYTAPYQLTNVQCPTSASQGGGDGTVHPDDISSPQVQRWPCISLKCIKNDILKGAIFAVTYGLGAAVLIACDGLTDGICGALNGIMIRALGSAAGAMATAWINGWCKTIKCVAVTGAVAFMTTFISLGAWKLFPTKASRTAFQVDVRYYIQAALDTIKKLF